jgi:hypothetical protein
MEAFQCVAERINVKKIHRWHAQLAKKWHSLIYGSRFQAIDASRILAEKQFTPEISEETKAPERRVDAEFELALSKEYARRPAEQARHRDNSGGHRRRRSEHIG